MKILMVGCGAVGQVFGLLLQEAGVELGLFDRPEAAVRLAQAHEAGGLTLFQVTGSRKRQLIPRKLERYTVLPDVEACRRFAPQQVWFTTPSQVYYTAWFRDFLQSVPAEQVACFIPEGGRAEFIPEKGADRLVFGGTAFMAWQGGAENGGGMEGGINFWLPPMGIPLVGKPESVRAVAHVLREAGFRVTIGKPGSRQQAAVTAVMTAFTAGLELAGWTLSSYRRSAWRRKAAAACRQAVASQLPGMNAFQRTLLSVPVLSIAFDIVARIMPWLVPFDIQKYLGFHYRKTRAQTLALLEGYIRDGQGRGLPVDAIRALREGLTGGGI